ncbi:MAG: T9SS type A sorting domain-containing protein, partial [Candidatus Firestonebacteria bacterium]
TNTSTQVIIGTKASDAAVIKVNTSSTGVSITSSTTWQATISLADGTTVCSATAVDSIGNESTASNLVTIYLTHMPTVTTVNPSTALNNTATSITINGTFFTDVGSTVLSVNFDGTGSTALTGFTTFSPNEIRASVPANIAAGAYNVKVTTSRGTNLTSSTKFTVTAPTTSTSSTTITSAIGGNLEITPTTNVTIRVTFDASTFTSTVVVSLVGDTVLPSGGRNPINDLGVIITNDTNAQPNKRVKITISYLTDSYPQLAGHTPTIGRYDEISNRWISLTTTIMVSGPRTTLEAWTEHLSMFGVLLPAADLVLTRVWPNPFTPAAGKDMIFDSLTANATLTIYSLVGEKLRELSNTDGDGFIKWDGANEAGSTVASGVYFAVIKSGSEVKRLKIAIQR